MLALETFEERLAQTLCGDALGDGASLAAGGAEERGLLPMFHLTRDGSPMNSTGQWLEARTGAEFDLSAARELAARESARPLGSEDPSGRGR
jgi:hypothetical protein